MVFQPQRIHPSLSEQILIISAASDGVDPVRLPSGKLLHAAAAITVVNKGLVVAVVMAWNRRRMGSPGLVDHGADSKSRCQHPIGIAANDLRRHNLFGRQDHMSAGQAGIAADSQIAPDMGIAVLISPLHMHDGHIRLNGRHGCQ